MWVLLLGDVLSFNMLLIVRRRYNPIDQHTVTAGPVTMSLDELNRRSRREHRYAWRLNLSWVVAAFVVLVTNWNPLPPSGRAGLIVLFLLLVGVFTSFHTFKHGKVGEQQRLASSITASWNTHRIDLIGKRDGLDLWSGVRTRWDLGGPPALLIVLIAFPFFLLLLGLLARLPLPQSVGTPFWWRSLAALLLLVVTWIFLRRVNDRAARTIQKELDALDTASKDDDSDARPS
jgi:hypothetical protein